MALDGSKTQALREQDPGDPSRFPLEFVPSVRRSRRKLAGEHRRRAARKCGRLSLRDGGWRKLSNRHLRHPARGECRRGVGNGICTPYASRVRTAPRCQFLIPPRLADVSSQRLTRIDVTSKAFGEDVNQPRHIVRRYHLGYDQDFHASLLTNVQLEGRCGAREIEARRKSR